MEVTLKNGDKTEIVIRPRFGMGRMEGVNTIHDIPSPEELAGQTEATEHMAKLLAKMEESGWVVDGYYAASSAFYGRKELDFFEYQKDRRLTRVYNDELYKWTKPIEKFTKATTKVLDDGTCFFALPIHITKESCLNCHGDVKVGDTKGYMVYVIRKSAVENPPT